MSPNPVLEFWAYAVLYINIVDTRVDASKTDSTSIDTVKVDEDSFLANCTFCSNRLVENKNNKP